MAEASRCLLASRLTSHVWTINLQTTGDSSLATISPYWRWLGTRPMAWVLQWTCQELETSPFCCMSYELGRLVMLGARPLGHASVVLVNPAPVQHHASYLSRPTAISLSRLSSSVLGFPDFWLCAVSWESASSPCKRSCLRRCQSSNSALVWTLFTYSRGASYPPRFAQFSLSYNHSKHFQLRHGIYYLGPSLSVRRGANHMGNLKFNVWVAEMALQRVNEPW